MITPTPNPSQAERCPPAPSDAIVTQVWQALVRATHDRHHAWKTPALATIGIDGMPQVRTIVLRHADPGAWMLTAYTDARSPKCLALQQHPNAELVCWSARLHWQLRISVTATVHVDGTLVEHAWARMRQSPSAKDYLSVSVPGSRLPDDHADAAAETQRDAPHHLAVLQFKVNAMDWLALGKNQHCRAKILPNGTVIPLVP